MILGAMGKHRNPKKRQANAKRDLAVPADVMERECHGFIEGRKFRKARDVAKQLCKRDQDRYLPLLIQANRGLAEDMLQTMIDAPGTGLAAPQVHVSLRMVIFRVPLTETDSLAGGEAPLTVLINPIVEPLGEEMEEAWEGCLSLPGLRGLVPRYSRIRYRGVDLAGAPIDRTAEGFHARVVQHECDHLDGILYPQRMDDLTGLIFESEMRHIIAEARAKEAANERAAEKAVEEA